MSENNTLELIYESMCGVTSQSAESMIIESIFTGVTDVSIQIAGPTGAVETPYTGVVIPEQSSENILVSQLRDYNQGNAKIVIEDMQSSLHVEIRNDAVVVETFNVTQDHYNIIDTDDMGQELVITKVENV